MYINDAELDQNDFDLSSISQLVYSEQKNNGEFDTFTLSKQRSKDCVPTFILEYIQSAVPREGTGKRLMGRIIQILSNHSESLNAPVKLFLEPINNSQDFYSKVLSEYGLPSETVWDMYNKGTQGILITIDRSKQ